MHDQEIVDNLEHVWQSIDMLCASFTEREWKTPTDLPGWSVQDNIAHIIDFESRMLGRPVPEHTPAQRPHMKNDLGRRNEIWVDWCRSWSGAEVLEAYREVIAARLQVLRAAGDAKFSAPSPISATGEPLRDHLQRRAVDCWSHEQDIRRAVSRPGHMDGPIVTSALDRMVGGMGMVCSRRAKAPDGSTIVLVITGPYSRTLALRVRGEETKSCDQVPETPTVRLSMDSETFGCLAFGRWEGQKVLESGRVLIAGDVELGRTIVRHMALTP